MRWITNGHCNERTKWHYWYAWYPVPVEYPDGRFQWVWLEKVQRRRVTDWDGFCWVYRLRSNI